MGAVSGMKTSQRRPRIRAAYASAWPWLPALAATTPAEHPLSPSADSLASAPRSLNDPVRWRFSVLSATVRPLRSLSVPELRTGVSRTMLPTARAARRMSSAVGSCAACSGSVSARDRHHRVDLDPGPHRQFRHTDRHPGRRIGLEEGLVDLVDGLERGHLGRVDGEPHGVSERGPGGLAYGGQVLQAAPG